MPGASLDREAQDRAMAEKFRLDRGTKDSDGDGLSDDFEKLVLGTNPRKRDSDGDGLSDLREKDFATNPLKADTDGDGLNDAREVRVGTNPHSKDSDQDKVPDKVEVQRGTAEAPDSDADGLPDWVDAVESDIDTDRDGLSDGEEAWLRTDMYSQHSDTDILPDGVEVTLGFDPRGPAPRADGQPEIRVPDGPYRGPGWDVGPPEIRVPSGPNTIDAPSEMPPSQSAMVEDVTPPDYADSDAMFADLGDEPVIEDAPAWDGGETFA
jgi:hypothetical protein